MQFRPSIVSTLATLFVAYVCVELGLWQLRRYDEAEGKAASVESRVHGDRLGNADMSGAAADLDWRPATLTGRFIADDPFVVAGGIAFRSAGYVLVEPFQVDGGPTLLVQRGWIPVGGWMQTIADTRVAGPTEISGLIRAIEPGMHIEPRAGADGDLPLWPLENKVFLGYFTRGVRIPYTSLAEAAGDVADVVLVAGPELLEPNARRTDVLPASGFLWRKKTFHHLEYAAQWFAFAAIALALWAWAAVRRARRLAASTS
jgi:surfeit locus 1 family protein